MNPHGVVTVYWYEEPWPGGQVSVHWSLENARASVSWARVRALQTMPVESQPNPIDLHAVDVQPQAWDAQDLAMLCRYAGRYWPKGSDSIWEFDPCRQGQVRT